MSRESLLAVWLPPDFKLPALHSTRTREQSRKHHATMKSHDTSNKLSSVLMAASALTTLAGSDEEGTNSKSGRRSLSISSVDNSEQQQLPVPPAKKSTSISGTPLPVAPLLPIPTKRHLPWHKNPNAALTFPEKVRYAW